MRHLALFLCMALSLSASAGDGITLRDVFRQMPDSLMPTLTQNNRLDFLDFLDAGMKAEVKNRLGGTSVMMTLTADSLSLQVSPALRVDMLLLPLAEPIDSRPFWLIRCMERLLSAISARTGSSFPRRR